MTAALKICWQAAVLSPSVNFLPLTQHWTSLYIASSPLAGKATWGAFHLAKIFGLKFRKFSVLKEKAFPMQAQKLAISLVDRDGARH